MPETTLTEDVTRGLCATYGGMTVDEVEAEISASSHADKVTDPRALAEYVVAMCAELAD